MTPEEFIIAYDAALATQTWEAVEPLIHEDACVTFSTGSVHRGKAAVERAYRENFEAIEDESYSIRNVHWVTRDVEFAVYVFDFSWCGLIDGGPASGSGRGTTVLGKDGAGWRLIAEHLGPDESS